MAASFRDVSSSNTTSDSSTSTITPLSAWDEFWKFLESHQSDMTRLRKEAEEANSEEERESQKYEAVQSINERVDLLKRLIGRCASEGGLDKAKDFIARVQEITDNIKLPYKNDEVISSHINTNTLLVPFMVSWFNHKKDKALWDYLQSQLSSQQVEGMSRPITAISSFWGQFGIYAMLSEHWPQNRALLDWIRINLNKDFFSGFFRVHSVAMSFSELRSSLDVFIEFVKTCCEDLSLISNISGVFDRLLQEVSTVSEYHLLMQSLESTCSINIAAIMKQRFIDGFAPYAREKDGKTLHLFIEYLERFQNKVFQQPDLLSRLFNGFPDFTTRYTRVDRRVPAFSVRARLYVAFARHQPDASPTLLKNYFLYSPHEIKRGENALRFCNVEPSFSSSYRPISHSLIATDPRAIFLFLQVFPSFMKSPKCLNFDLLAIIFSSLYPYSIVGNDIRGLGSSILRMRESRWTFFKETRSLSSAAAAAATATATTAAMPTAATMTEAAAAIPAAVTMTETATALLAAATTAMPTATVSATATTAAMPTAVTMTETATAVLAAATTAMPTATVSATATTAVDPFAGIDEDQAKNRPKRRR